MSKNYDVGENNEKYAGKRFSDFVKPIEFISTKSKKFKEAEIKSMLDMVAKEMISFSRFVELINERIDK